MDEAAENRNYLAHRMTDEINEIIRVLQLTTYDEDEWESDDLNLIKKAQVIAHHAKICVVDKYSFRMPFAANCLRHMIGWKIHQQ